MDDKFDEDPLGFTRQTKMLLVGLGCEYLVDEARRRNLSSEELPKLSKDDLITLGVPNEDVDKVHESFKKLAKSSNSFRVVDNWYGIIGQKNVIDIIRDGRRHLDLITTYMKYCRHNLINERDKEFDDDANDSVALHLAANSVLKEFHFLQDNLEKLKNDVEDKKKNQFSCVKLCIIISVLGITGCVVFYKR